MKNFINDLIYIWKYEGKLKALFIVFIILSSIFLVGVSIWFEVMKYLALNKFINN